MLYIVATPIGNLQDISTRALQILNSVSKIYAEDTRVTTKLCHYYNISTPLSSLQQHNEAEICCTVLLRLQSGDDIALVSDAGMPLISDPGQKLVSLCRNQNIDVVVIPGASAVTTAVAGCGIEGRGFLFYGFLPAKQQQQITILRQLSRETVRLVFFESPHRIAKTVALMLEEFGDRQCCLARELTKMYETWHHGTLNTIAQQMTKKHIQQRGEFTIIIAGSEPTPASLVSAQRVFIILRKELNASKAAALASKLTGVSKQEIYPK